MNWHSLAEFAAMGGYGLYVWGSVLLCLLAVVVELAGVRLRRHQIVQVLRTEAAQWPESTS